ncbi:hypothetical protein FM107_15950 [Sphingobacterium sp. JB170]|nr:hypothetical protein FM107_15950 [Sphingobacterium sp. JB170]
MSIFESGKQFSRVPFLNFLPLLLRNVRRFENTHFTMKF